VQGDWGLGERREALERACAALDGLESDLWQATGPELGPLMALVDEVGRRVGAGRFAVLAEAVERGEVGGGVRQAHGWLLEWAPSFRAGGSAAVVKVLDHSRLERYAGLRAALLAARVPIANAACVVEEYERFGHLMHPLAQVPAMEALVEAAEQGGRRDVRAIRNRVVARYGREGRFQAEQDRMRSCALLSQPMDDGTGLYEYRMLLDPEAKAVVEAAVQALSAPRPADGEPDHRPSGQRRVEALLEVVRRGVASAAHLPSSPKAELHVAMTLDDLVRRTDAGRVFGSGAAGDLIGPETVRRLACDAGVVPRVLGSDGELLELGRRVRLFTPSQVKALWLRDGHCTFPGCTVPAGWCDAHHLWHWGDGGPTDLANAALLCGRHHTVVHHRGFHGRLQAGGVVWDLTPGAYDHWLATRRAPEPPKPPKPPEPRR
jgi:Domain of unknown function (DUF222)